jgi:hypothetical protein
MLRMNALDLILYTLALIACHRIWHREDIFAQLRTLLSYAGWWAKPLVCPPCSPIWIGLGLAAVWPLLPTWVVWPLAAYPPVRLLVFLYRVDWGMLLPGRTERADRMQAALDAAVAKQRGPAPPVRITGGCASCEEAAAAGAARIAPASAPSTVRAAATAEIAVAVPLDAPEQALVGAAQVVNHLANSGLTARLIGIGATPSAPAVRTLTEDNLRHAANLVGLHSDDVLTATGERSLHIADVVVLAGPRAGELQWDAAMHGVLIVVPPGHASIGAQASVVVDLPTDSERAADRVADLLLISPTYHARKAVLRSGTASRRPQN